MNLKKLFKRKKYASPYYGGSSPLVSSSAIPLRQDNEEADRKPVLDISQVRIPYPRPNEVDWELRRFELMKMFVAQERRSVVLGKLRANDKQIAAKARALTDAAIKELQSHPFKSGDEQGGKADDE